MDCWYTAVLPCNQIISVCDLDCDQPTLMRVGVTLKVYMHEYTVSM